MRYNNYNIKYPHYTTPPKEKGSVEFEWWEPNEDSLPAAFCLDSSLHGLKFIAQPKRHIVERIFWCIAFLISVNLAIYSIIKLWEKYRDTPVVTVFQPSEIGIHSVPFPAITICNSNNAIKKKSQQIIARALTETKDNPEAFDDLYMLRHLCETKLTFAQQFKYTTSSRGINSSVDKEILNFRRANNLKGTQPSKPFSEFMNNVSQKCSDMILLCMWNDEIYDCNELFDETETDVGSCCTFNMAPKSVLLKLRKDSRDKEESIKAWQDQDLNMDKLILPEDDDEIDTQPAKDMKTEYPRRQYRPGKSSGLSVLLNPDMESYFCSTSDSAGFVVLAHNPLDFPSVADNGLAIKPDSEAYIKIRPEVTLADADIRGFPVEKRNCYFGTEYPLKYYQFYTGTNCEDECMANLTSKECSCVRYYMPRGDSDVTCGHRGHDCSEKVRKKIVQEGIQKDCKVCLPTCTEILYHSTISHMPMRKDVPLWEYPNGTVAAWNDKNVTILHVHFSVDSTHPKLRTKLYGILDLISNTGGLLGLCLGLSALSFLEIIYFVTLRACCRCRKKSKENDYESASKMNLLAESNREFYFRTVGTFSNGTNQIPQNQFKIRPTHQFISEAFYSNNPSMNILK